MQRKIVAIGGGGNGRIKPDGKPMPYETMPIDKEIIRLTKKEFPNFLLIAHSKLPEEQEEAFQTMKKIYHEKYNCPCKDLKSNELMSEQKVNVLIDWADIIYEYGGNTLDMIKLWKETGFDKILKKAWEKGKVMCGSSAGANCWFKSCSSDSLKIKYGLKEPLIRVECLNFINALFVPHCNEAGRSENAKELLKNSDEVGLLVSNCAAIEIIDDQYRIILSDTSNHNISAYALKAYWKNGQYIEEKITNPEFKPLIDLLSKTKQN